MLKQAWRSYILSFHPDNMKERLSKRMRSIYRFLLFLIILLSINGDRNAWVTFLHLLPLMIMNWGAMGGGIRLEKKMFLSPMKQQDRENYIRYLLLLKIGSPIFLGFLIEIIRSFVVGIDMWGSIGKLLCYLFAGIGTFIHADAIDKTGGAIVPARKDRNGKMKWSWINVVTSVCGGMAIIMYDHEELFYKESQFPEYLLGFCVLLFFIFSVMILVTQYRPMIEYLTDYDRVSGLSVKDKYVEEEQ